MSDFAQIKVLVPSCICNINESRELYVNSDGFTPLEISWNGGFVTNIKSIEIDELDEVKRILFPRFAEETSYREPLITSLDGNTVELAVEQMQFAENSMRYTTTVNFLNGKINKIISAIKGE